jgi:exodeoxyribonuclease-3
MWSEEGVNTLIVMSWNVNGIRAIQKRGFLDWVEEAQPNVLALQETKVNDDTLPETLRDIPGYESHFSYASTRRGCSGVAVYSRIGVVSAEPSFGVPEWDDEGRHLLIDFGDFILANVYFPNGRASADRLDYKMRYYAEFLKFAGKTIADGKNLVICGDYNTAHREIDLARPRENSKTSGFLPEERAWMDSLVDAGFVDTFRLFNDSPEQYSWWSQRSGARSRNVGWRLDYFFVNSEFQSRVVDAKIHADVLGSDHCPVAIEIM